MENLIEVVNPGAIQELSAQLIKNSCSCLECKDFISGQRLTSIVQLDPELTIVEVNESDSSVHFILSDGHNVTLESEIVEDMLLELVPLNWRSESAKTMWNEENAPLGIFAFDQISTQDANLFEMLDQLISFGFAIVEKVPNRDRAVIELINLFGFTRITNYGDIFDVRVQNDPNNLAFTNLAIAPHTDNPYRDPVPTIQLLHCLETTVEGGHSGLVDGFRAAAQLRESNPQAFELLTTRLFHFEYKNADTYLNTSSPIIRLNAINEIVEIRWNDRSMQPPFNEDGVDDVYDALRSFAKTLNNPSNMFNFKLEPGQAVIFDNTRVLHARTGFDSAGKRHLQGAYADLDSAISKWSILQDKLDV